MKQIFSFPVFWHRAKIFKKIDQSSPLSLFCIVYNFQFLFQVGQVLF